MRYSKAVTEVTKAEKKHGKLKGKNKQEKRTLKAICPHHIVTKHGKLKRKFFIQDGMCICTMCGQRFSPEFYKKEDVADIVNSFEELNNQSKYIATAINAGNKTSDYLSQIAVLTSTYPKVYKKLVNVAKKSTQIKKKKRKNNYGGSSQYGSWGTHK